MVDLNDRALRHVNVGLGGPLNGIPREDGFDITVASEIMAILCLATDINDLKERLANIVVAYRYDRTPVYVRDLEIEGALTLILKDAIKPNLVQTIYGTPALVHGGPFANIAHGCNSVLATATALRLADYTITEAGFGADLGAEKFLDIKTPNLPTTPDAVVIVATLRALKMHGGVAKTDLSEENVQAVRDGFANLKRHVENVRKFGLPAVVAINEFVADTEAEIAALKELCAEIDVPVELASVWANGADGGIDLANAVVDAVENGNADYKRLYSDDDSLEAKITKIVTEIYGGKSVVFEKKAKNQLKQFAEFGWDKLPVCMAKTQYSFSDNQFLLGAPEGFDITIREFVPKTGAGFIVALTGDVMTMPGLPKAPAALKMDVAEDGTAVGMGIANAVTRLKDSKAKSKVIILLTDGTNNKGDISPLTAAEIAKSFGIRVYTIGVGTNGMAPYPVRVGGTTQYINTPVEIDEKTLTQIAGTTDGNYFRATSNSKLKEVYEEIDKLEKTKLNVKEYSKRQEEYRWFALAAFLCILLEVLLRNSILKKIP